MTIERRVEYRIKIVQELCKLSTETEWLEFKHNNANPEKIGEYISALSNSAALLGKDTAYIVWGVSDQTHDLIGTDFKPRIKKVGGEDFESWLLKLLDPKIHFRFFELRIKDYDIVLLEIDAAIHQPVRFKNQEFIRVGSYKKNLKIHPEKERALWRIFDRTPFERQIAAEHLAGEEVLHLLNCPAYFGLLNEPLPGSLNMVLDYLQTDGMIQAEEGGSWKITNLGALLFAKRLADFQGLKRKAPRVIFYKGEDRLEAVREREEVGGYASGFEGLVEYILSLLPGNEVIKQAFRENITMFPPLAVRELVANAIIHQDFQMTGTGPLIEVFSRRVEITNPGLPLMETDRFLDSPPRSRNESLASFMRRIGVCEERGGGIDKVVSQTEFFQLPAPAFEVTEGHTRCVLFSHRLLREMDKGDRTRACYLHACLRYVQRDYMTNSTLRERFGIEGKNIAMATRIIKDALNAGKICIYDESAGRRYVKYIPWWATPTG